MTNGEQMTADQDSTSEPSASEPSAFAERVLTEMGVE